MNKIEKIMCLTLSSANDEERVHTLENEFILVNEDDLYAKAKVDEVDSHIAWLLKKSKLTYKNFWNDSLISVESRIGNLMEELERVASFLKERQIPIVGLKNAGITKGIYPVLACSPMGDIDLLISRKHFFRAHEILVNELGYTFKFRSDLEDENIEEAFVGGGTEYFKDVKGYKVWLELQWRPIAGRWIQPHNELNGDVLLERSIQIDGSSVRLLSPEDNLLQVALHTAKHSYVRAPGFRLHSDVDRVVRHQNINWEIFTQRTKKLRLTTAVYFSLYYAEKLLKTPIPTRIIEELKPNFLRRKAILYFINRAGLFNQKKKKFSKIGYVLFTLCLYDSFAEIFQAVFPPAQIMKKHYSFQSNWKLPYYHVVRLKGLMFDRAKL